MVDRGVAAADQAYMSWGLSGARSMTVGIQSLVIATDHAFDRPLPANPDMITRAGRAEIDPQQSLSGPGR
jgi:hypothetical protein